MPYENICISCFRDKGNSFTCPHCGYVESGSRKSIFLPERILLNDRYLIGEVLNSDKNSIFYKAFDTKASSVVEIQEFFPRTIVSRSSDSAEVIPVSGNFSDDFLKNVKTIKKNAERMYIFKSSDNIINIYDSFEANNTVYIVNEYIEGLTLSDYLKSGSGRLDTETALSIIIPILDGLSEIHRNGLIHRAITPGNIILTVDNKIKIVNFSYLKDASPYKESPMTVLFTPGYAPLEQYVSMSKVGAFTDVYSAGAVLYKMITGKSPPDVLNRTENDTLKAELEKGDDIPEYIALAILKAMETDSELRFKNAAAFKNCLLQKEKIVDVGGEIIKIKNKKVALAVAVSAAVIVVILFLIYFLFLY